jgi:hypothetical protein
MLFWLGPSVPTLWNLSPSTLFGCCVLHHTQAAGPALCSIRRTQSHVHPRRCIAHVRTAAASWCILCDITHRSCDIPHVFLFFWALIISARFKPCSWPPMPVEDDSSPPPTGRKPVPVPAYLTPSPPVQARIKRVKQAPTPRSPAPKQSSRRFQLQADEASDGQSSNQGSNSSSDADEGDLSNISPTSQHADAEAHVYAAGASSQGGFPTPLHQRRGADRGLLSLAGFLPTHPKP